MSAIGLYESGEEGSSEGFKIGRIIANFHCVGYMFGIRIELNNGRT